MTSGFIPTTSFLKICDNTFIHSSLRSATNSRPQSMVASLPEVGQKMYSMKAITLPSRPQCAVCRLSRSAPSIRTLVFDGTESASALKH